MTVSSYRLFAVSHRNIVDYYVLDAVISLSIDHAIESENRYCLYKINIVVVAFPQLIPLYLLVFEWPFFSDRVVKSLEQASDQPNEKERC